MINLDDFNLIYIRTKDGVKFLVKYVTHDFLRLISSEDGSVIGMSEAKVRARFRPDKKTNKLNKKRPVKIVFGRYSEKKQKRH